jgi:hypothetical protein
MIIEAAGAHGIQRQWCVSGASLPLEPVGAALHTAAPPIGPYTDATSLQPDSLRTVRTGASPMPDTPLIDGA